ncbi:MAG TPA: hypothetical protein VH661_08780 [Candidatus Dormibacteraeota bacterium]|jgi:hypothetical protein|nr:hypothetical protein [Candidatus Dormibacteraeota bacterium]
MPPETVSTYFGLVGELAGRLEEALSGGDAKFEAADRAQHVAMRLRLGLLSRASAVGVLADTGPAQAAMYDCLRTMCEAASHLTWLVAKPEATQQRALCIELGQAKADAHNRVKVLAVHRAALLDPDTREQMEKNLNAAEEVVRHVQETHGSSCKQCGGRGRNETQVPTWLKQQATKASATTDEVNLFALWVGCSADVHQLVPQRHSREDGHHLELPGAEVGLVVRWAIDTLLMCFPLVAKVVRPEVVADVEAVGVWWKDVMRNVDRGVSA